MQDDIGHGRVDGRAIQEEDVVKNLRGWLAAVALAAWGMGAQALDLSSVEDSGSWQAYSAVPADCEEMYDVVAGAPIEVSGAFNVAAYGRWAEGRNANGRLRTVSSTAFEADVAAIWLKVKASENHGLTVKLDLDDAWNNQYDKDDFLEEIYYTFKNIGGTGFGVHVGKMEVPFGYDKDTLLVHPYLHAQRETNFTKRANGSHDPFRGTGITSPLSGAYSEHHPVEYDNLFAITPYWKSSNDKWMVEASLFQSKQDVNGDRRSSDNMGFKSGAVRVKFRPLEKLVLQASVITRYNDASGINHANGLANTTRRQYATSVAADYTFELFCRDLNVFAEWQHGWNTRGDIDTRHNSAAANFFKDTSSDDVHFGLGYELNKTFKLHLQGEWLAMRNDKKNGTAADADSSLWRALVALETKLPGGITMESGLQHEWLKLKNAKANGIGKDRYEATTWYSGLKFRF